MQAPRPPTALELGSRALEAERRRLRERRKHLTQLARSERKDAAKLRAAERAEKAAELRLKREIIREYGLYDPRSLELTPYRRATINRIYRQLEQLLEGAAFAEYPTGKEAYRQGFKAGAKAARKEIRREAKSIGAKPTRKGVFVYREARELRQPKGKLRYDKRTGFFEMKVGKVVQFEIGGKKRRRRITETKPIAGATALVREEKRLNDRWANVVLKPNQRIRFIINGVNASRQVFRSMASLVSYAKKYRDTDRGRATFLKSLTIEIQERLPGRRRGRAWDNWNTKTVGVV